MPRWCYNLITDLKMEEAKISEMLGNQPIVIMTQEWKQN
jgi:hypothetical protein